MISRLTLILAFLCAGAARADDSFTKALTPEDFQAAGLGKLTPDELAKLDALVRGERTGAVAQATDETTKVVTEKVTAAVTEKVTATVTQTVRQQVQAEDKKAEQKKAASESFLDRMKVVLKPGTQVEYTTLDAVLVPPFHGWDPGTILTLTNGQRWVVSDNVSYWAPKTYKPVHVKIVPAFASGFFMEIENGGRPRVKFLDNIGPSAPTPAPPQN
jgi:hypothetical protein